MTLDPPDWREFRELAHSALDDALDFVQNVRDRPVWQPVPDAVKVSIAEAPPEGPQGVEAAYRDLRQLVLPYTVGNVHPRFLGWVHGAGLPTGIIAELMAAAMNVNCGGRDHAGLYVERAVIDWSRSLVGYPPEAKGVLLTGTSMANLSGLTVARNARSGGDIRRGGLQGYPKRLVAYTSTQSHASIDKALELLGLGTEGLRKIGVDDAFQIDIDALRRAIVRDRDAGLEPFCVIGNAGDVNTGSIDDLVRLADACEEYGLWLHVDGAFGALGMLSDQIRPRLRGIERADSLAFDFHKWMHVQYDAGCLLVRDGAQLLKTFSTRADYLQHTGRGLSGGGEWPSDLSPELSRAFRALKIWFALKAHGVEAFRRSIDMNCSQATYLAGLVARLPEVELLNAPSLSIVCFRFRPSGWHPTAVDRLNEDVAIDLQESGVAVVSTTRIRGGLTIRVNITNHRTTEADLDLLVRSAFAAAQDRIGSNFAP